MDHIFHLTIQPGITNTHTDTEIENRVLKVKTNQKVCNVGIFCFLTKVMHQYITRLYVFSFGCLHIEKEKKIEKMICLLYHYQKCHQHHNRAKYQQLSFRELEYFFFFINFVVIIVIVIIC